MRALISIGCDEYDNVGNLAGAHKDAKSIYDALLSPEIGEYSAECSVLLFSPTLEELRSAIKRVLLTGGVDVLTFFFAGHGGVSKGAFYLYVKDSIGSSPSLSAYSLSELLRVINSVSVMQSNIIFDACHSGGLINDLSTLLKPEVIGDAGTPAVTLLAMAAQNQYAMGGGGGGAGTNALLDCLYGRDFVQDSRPALDLVEVGRRISERFKGTEQVPVVWGLNLSGAPSFCKNLRFTQDSAATFRFGVNSLGPVRDIVSNEYPLLWRAYDQILTNEWRAVELSFACQAAIDKLFAVNPSVAAYFVEQLSAACFERAKGSEDACRRLEVLAALSVPTLRYLRDPAIRSVAKDLAAKARGTAKEVLNELLYELKGDGKALLSRRGVSDFYVLPIRISKICGWASFCELFGGKDPSVMAEDGFLEGLVQAVEVWSPNSFELINDGQAPYLAVFFAALSSAGLHECGERVLGRYFNSAVGCRAMVAKPDIDGASVLGYLIARHLNDYSSVEQDLQRPSEALAVILRSAKLFDLEGVFDKSLWKLDRSHMLIYHSKDVSDFAYSMMRGGLNYVYTIGRDIFRMEDLNRCWPQDCPGPRDELESSLSVLASFLFEDRVPWHLLPGRTHGVAVPA